MAQAMTVEIESALNPTSDIFTPELAEAFSNQLLLHHATHEEKLNKKAFEYVLKYAFEAVGTKAYIDADPTHPGADIVADGVSFSLKTQADAAVTRSGIYIQKLMEARWIRDFDGARLAEEAVRRITAHLSSYQRILVLRAYDEGRRRICYEVQEIPKAVLLLVGDLTAGDFSPKSRYGSSGADVRDEAGVVFRVLLDGSVEKVRIFNLRTSRCFRHGEWKIPVAVGGEEG
jgi:hypothetical protein